VPSGYCNDRVNPCIKMMAMVFIAQFHVDLL
jgi:hypothetical protein